MFEYTHKRVQFSLDDGPTQSLNLYLFCVGNGKFFGGGMKVAPDAVIDDGLFSVITMENVSILQVRKTTHSLP